ncbi:MAG: C-5 sterol desaturase, partial [Flavobacteriales bacterium]
FEFQEIWRDMKKSPKLKDKFMYVFGPPGWSHDGSSKTSHQLQEEMRKNGTFGKLGQEPVAKHA